MGFWEGFLHHSTVILGVTWLKHFDNVVKLRNVKTLYDTITLWKTSAGATAAYDVVVRKKHWLILLK